MPRVNLTQKIVEATPYLLAVKAWIISTGACPALCFVFQRAGPKAGTPFIASRSRAQTDPRALSYHCA